MQAGPLVIVVESRFSIAGAAGAKLNPTPDSIAGERQLLRRRQ